MKSLIFSDLNGRIVSVFHIFMYTNTYAPTEKLSILYNEALKLPGAAGLHIATRADCLPESVVNLLEDISQKNYIVVELGMADSIWMKLAAKINQRHSFAEFLCRI